MGVQRWLEYWDRRNAAALSEEIPDDVRQLWRWRRQGDPAGTAQLIAPSGWLLGRVVPGRVILDESGVTSRLLRRRSWRWEQVAFLTWDVVQLTSTLAICLYGNPYVHHLAWGHCYPRPCRALLEDSRSFVEGHGAQIRNTTDPAPSMWWATRPEAQWGFERS